MVTWTGLLCNIFPIKHIRLLICPGINNIVLVYHTSISRREGLTPSRRRDCDNMSLRRRHSVMRFKRTLSEGIFRGDSFHRCPLSVQSLFSVRSSQHASPSRIWIPTYKKASSHEILLIEWLGALYRNKKIVMS